MGFRKKKKLPKKYFQVITNPPPPHKNFWPPLRSSNPRLQYKAQGTYWGVTVSSKTAFRCSRSSCQANPTTGWDVAFRAKGQHRGRRLHVVLRRRRTIRWFWVKQKSGTPRKRRWQDLE